MPQIRETDVQAMLQKSKDPQVKDMASLPATVAAATRVLNVTLELMADAPRSGAGVAGFAVQKAVAISDVATLSKPAGPLVKGAGLVAQTGLISTGLIKLANGVKTPNQLLIGVTLATAQKVVLAAGFGEVDRCRLAFASLVANGGMGLLVCTTAGAPTVGAACLVGAVTTAADLFSVYDACYASGAGNPSQ